MTKKQAIWKSILHWRRMIKWAEKQPKKNRANHQYMYGEIGEWWDSLSCDLCKVCDDHGDCPECPLSIKYGSCKYPGKNMYRSVVLSLTWEEWLKNARRMLRQLESLRK